MKKALFLGLACALLLTACNVTITGSSKRIEPSENIVRRELKMARFDEVDINVIANVKIMQSADGDSRVVLTMPENYVELYNIGVDDGELSVEFRKDGNNIDATNVDITIYTPTLRKLTNEGLANVETDRLEADRLEVENDGVGSLFLSGLSVKLIEAESSGVGSIELSGTADEAQLDCSGVGSIKAAGLVARSVRAEVSGVGSITCHATEHIKGDVSGVGSLRYGGNPGDKDLSRSGVGKIVEL